MDFINKEFETIKKELESMELNITKGTKKMIRDFHLRAVNNKNEKINCYIEEYTRYKIIILEELEKRKNKLIPINLNIDYDKKNKLIQDIKKLLHLFDLKGNPKEVLEINKVFYQLDNLENNNLNTINLYIEYLLNTLKKSNVTVTLDDFNYTNFTRKFMEPYFIDDNIENVKQLADTLDDIFWQCPSLINQIRYNFEEILNKNKKKLLKYSEDFINDQIKEYVDYQTLKETYIKNIGELKNIKIADKYLLTQDFLSENIPPDNYLFDSDIRKENFNFFLINKEFSALTDNEKEIFFTNITDIMHILQELENVNYFKKIIEDINKRYESKDTYKNLLKEKEKELKKERSILKSDFKKAIPKKSIFKKKNLKPNEKFINKQNETFNKLKDVLSEYNDILININLINKINENSTIIDGLKFAINNYDYFIKLYESTDYEEKIDELYEKLLNFVYDFDNTFIDQVQINKIDTIVELIINKYRLLEINLTKEDLVDNINELKNKCEYILRIYYIEKSGLDLNDFVLINKIKGIINDEQDLKV